MKDAQETKMNMTTLNKHVLIVRPKKAASNSRMSMRCVPTGGGGSEGGGGGKG